jgi:hypothetical protein
MRRASGLIQRPRIGVLLAGAFAAGAFLAPAGAGAATITVTGTDDLTGSFDDPGLCNLRDAVTAANTNAPFSECPGDNGGGTGNDTILLQGGQTYTLTNHATPEDANASGDLDVTGGGITTIRSTGSGLATVDADSTAAPAGGNSARGRALEVLSTAGGLTLEGIRATGGTVTDGFGGGGIRSLAALTLINSEVTGNSTGILATNVFGGYGGGIAVYDPGALTMTGSTVAENTVRANPSSPIDSARGGGIIYQSFSHPFNATNSTISGNVVDSQGNTGNTTYAGGIYWAGLGGTVQMHLTNVTVSNNSAIDSKPGGDTTVLSAGGIVIFEANGATSNATITNSIIAGNTAPAQADCGQVNADDDFISGGNNVFGDFSACGHTGGSNDAFFTNPNLGSLSNYGGLTRTQILNPGSPAINRGGSCPETDQRGFFRAAAPPCDAGALELNASITAPGTPAGNTPPSSAGQTAAKKCKKKKHKRSAVAARKCKKKK